VAQSEIILTIENVELIEFYGQNDAKLNLVKKVFNDVSIIPRGNQIKLTGDKKRVQECKATLEMMLRMLQEFGELNAQAVQNLLNGENPFESKLKTDSKNIILYGRTGQAIVARTKNQKKIVELSDINDILFAIGPAGTGKTYTAVALAVKALKNNQVRRIILTRPAVEAGENLGFLPGDLKDKIDPYLRPLYDALDDMIQPEKLTQFMTNRIIEVAPLAFMRGRTLDNAFVILDEAQNATEMQLKMFLTRLGPSAKCIITGDLTQIDLPKNQRSGLFRSLRLLDNIEGIGVVHLETGDVVRHRLVKAIINAYDKDDEMQAIRKHERERDAQENEQKNKEENQ
jgi:phosphate starvation-inducible PhoH-like protein